MIERLTDLHVRLAFGFIAACVVGLMATAYYMEYVMMLEPCPLCMTQRIFLTLMGAVALAGAIHGPGPTGQKWYAGGAIGLAFIGSGFSIRQLYLQSLPPDQAPACGPGLSYMWEYFPLSEVLTAMFVGTGNCATVSWTLLGISIPGWVLVAFIGLSAVAALALLRSPAAAGAPAMRSTHVTP